MALREKNGKWHYRFQVDGVIYRGSTGLEATERNRTDALRIEVKARDRVEGGEALRLEARSFNDAAQAFLLFADGEYAAHPNSAKRLRTSFASLCEFFSGEMLRQITRGRINDFKAWRRSEHQVKDVTIRHDLHALSLAFQYFIDHNWARRNPVEAEDIPSDADAVRMNILTPEEERLYFSEAWTHAALHDVGRIMIQQGCRPDEVLNLQVPDVDLERKSFKIRQGKSRAARRTLLMTPEVFEILKRRVKEAKWPWLFPGEAAGQRLQKLNGPHERVLDRLAVCRCTHPKKQHNGGDRRHCTCHCGCGQFEEVERLTCVIYDFRHTFATRKAEQGMPLATLAAILGHANIRSIMKYVHVTQEAMDRAMEQYGQDQLAEESKERVQ
jgi:integrase